jgi:integrase
VILKEEFVRLMGTLIKRPRKDGTVGYTARVKLKRGGKILFSLAQTFDRESAANAWITKKEKEIYAPDFLEVQKKSVVTLAEAIDRYISQSRKILGRTKLQTLGMVKRFEIADMDVVDIRSEDLVQFADELGRGGRKPSTVIGYLSHLSAVFSVVRAAWGIPVRREVMQDALEACKRLGLIATSTKRSRRPTIDELTRLYKYFQERRGMPMHHVMAFAVFSARRQEEITRIRWDDLEADRILVRDMKDPRGKAGNNIWCDLPPEARRVVEQMPPTHPEIFPFKSDSISTAFTVACKLLEIEGLHFHDLRHEGASRLFEMGWTIPKVATVTGHRSWQSLQRYSHLRQTGDKLANWP